MKPKTYKMVCVCCMCKTENVFKSTSNKIYYDCFKLNYPSSRLPRHRFNCHRMENHELQSVYVCFVSYIVSMLLFAFDIFFLLLLLSFLSWKSTILCTTFNIMPNCCWLFVFPSFSETTTPTKYRIWKL